MKAIDFIKNNGVDKAREVLRCSPALECYFVPKYQQYFVDKHGFVYVLGMFGYFTPSLGMTIENLTKYGFQTSDLKRLVESVDFINKFGGIDLAKAYDKQMIDHGFDPFFDKAIADYEAIYSNDCEILDHPEDYTSPNCKKFDERVK